MPASKTYRKILRTITVHPPEADAIARAFGDSRREAEQEFQSLLSVSQELDAGWEGNQKARYLEEMRGLTDRIRNLLIPQLTLFEKKYREYTVEKTIEETVEL
jgi:hypothetical protein